MFSATPWFDQQFRITVICAKALLTVAIAVAALSACAPTRPDYVRPELDVPPAAVTPIVIESQWWQGFADPVLDQLITEALAHNYDLAKAAANVAEARANTGIARAMLWPRLDGVAGAEASKRQLSLAFLENDSDKITSTARIGAVLNWEADLWGRIGEMNEAALARLSASEHARNATELSISTTVAESYFQLRSFDDKLAITREGLDHLEAISNLEYRRWQAQVGTELAYRQSVAEAASVEARMPDIESAVARTELALKLLVGRSPRAMADRLPHGASRMKLPQVLREIDSALLLRRPDVASAERLLIATHADLNSVRAEIYPRLNISLAGGWIATSSKLISGIPFFWDAAAGLAAPIFDAGLIESKVEGAEARRQWAVAHYLYIVSAAFRDAYESLILIDAGDRQAVAYAAEVAARRKSVSLNQKSYDAGRSSKFEVLSETIKALNAELALADARLNQLVARSHYYKALGGGF